MKKIITLLTILLLSKFSFGTTTPHGDISLFSPTYPNCHDGKILVSNIYNEPYPGFFLDGFDVILFRWNGRSYDQIDYRYIVPNLGAALFLNLPVGDYAIEIYFFSYFDNGSTYYNRTLASDNTCPIPTISSIVNASSSQCYNGSVTMSNGEVFYGLSPGNKDLWGHYSCGCNEVFYPVHAYVGYDDPYPTVSSITNASSPLCSDGIVYMSNGDVFYGQPPGYHNLPGYYNSGCGYLQYNVPAYVNTDSCNFYFSAIVTGTITNCSSGSILITTNNPACVQYYIVRVFDNDGNLVYNIANNTTSPSELPLKIDLSPGGHYSVTMDAYGSNGGVCSAAHDIDIDIGPRVTLTGGTTVCFGDSTTLTATGGNTYLWQPGSLSGAVQTFNGIMAGSIDYTVYAANSDSTCFDTATVTVTTLAATTASITGGNSCALNTLTANSNSTPANFVWEKDSIEVSSSATDPTYTPTTPGSYTVEITDINGCTATSPAFVIHDDEGVLTTYYRDADNDNYGNAGSSVQNCSLPVGYVTNNTDCNDNDASTHPGAIEICDGKDNNCNGLIDDGCSIVAIAPQPASVNEGNKGKINMTFVVSLSAPAITSCSVNYQTVPVTATAGTDYTSVSGTLSFKKGQASKTVVVKINGDTNPEANETFNLVLSNPVNLVISQSTAIGTIINDDGAPLTKQTTYSSYSIPKSIDQEPACSKIIIPTLLQKNQIWNIQGLPLLNTIKLFNANGQTVFKADNYKNNSSFNNLTPGVYFYEIVLRNKEGKTELCRGKMTIVSY